MLLVYMAQLWELEAKAWTVLYVDKTENYVRVYVPVVKLKITSQRRFETSNFIDKMSGNSQTTSLELKASYYKYRRGL